MKVVALKVENLGLVSYAELNLDNKGHVIQVAGKNGAGKSTLINALIYAFGGKSVTPSGVVKEGEDKSQIEVVLDNGVTIRRVIKDDGTQTVSIASDTNKYSSPQAVLDAWSGKLPDPQEMSLLTGKDLKKKILEFANVDVTGADASVLKFEQLRVEAGRQMKKNGVPDKVEKAEMVDVKLITDEKNLLDSFNQEQEFIKSKAQTYKMKIEHYKSEKQGLVQRKIELEKQISEIDESLKKGALILSELAQPEPPKDLTEINDKIDNINSINQAAVRYNDYLKNLENYESLKKSYEDHDLNVKSSREERDRLLNENVPVADGMTLTENGVDVSGRGWEVLSTSERLSIAVDLSTQISPDLKMMYIHRGESILSDKRDEISRLLEKHGDWVLLLEVASDTPGTDSWPGFVIEDGNIVKEFVVED